MANAYPSAGSASAYVSREIHPALGYFVGWGMIFDYVMNPIICVSWCSKAAMNFLPEVPFGVFAVFFAALFIGMNLRGIEASVRTKAVVAAGLGAVIVLFFGAAIGYLWLQPPFAVGRFDDKRRVLMRISGVFLEPDFAVMIDQGESNEDLVSTVSVNVGDRRIVSHRSRIMPEHPRVVGHAPHVPIAVLDHEVLAASPARQVREQEAVIRRRREREAGLLPPGETVQHDHRRIPVAVAGPFANVRRSGRRWIQIDRLADIEHFVPSVSIPVKDLHRQVAAGPAVLARRFAVLP